MSDEKPLAMMSSLQWWLTSNAGETLYLLEVTFFVGLVWSLT